GDGKGDRPPPLDDPRVLVEAAPDPDAAAADPRAGARRPDLLAPRARPEQGRRAPALGADQLRVAATITLKRRVRSTRAGGPQRAGSWGGRPAGRGSAACWGRKNGRVARRSTPAAASSARSVESGRRRGFASKTSLPSVYEATCAKNDRRSATKWSER